MRLHDDVISNAGELDYQFGKPLDIWSGALWLGAALQALVDREAEGDETARTWLERIPNEVKARWPGVFPDEVASR